MLKYVERSQDKLDGTPVFEGTRIPIRILIDYLKEGYTVSDFLEQYDIDPDIVHGFMDALGDDFSSDKDDSSHKKVRA